MDIDLDGPDVPKLTGLGPIRPGVKAPVAAPRPGVIQTPRGPVTDDLFGWRVDALRDSEGTDPEVIAHLEAENKFASEVMARTLGLQSVITKEIKGRVQLIDQSVPVEEGEYHYYRRIEASQNYWIHCRRFKAMSAPEEIILDENALANGHEILAIGEIKASPDGRLLAYSLNNDGKTVFSIRVRDLTTGLDLPDQIDGVSGEMAWGNDNASLFYCNVGKADRPFQIGKHVLGAAASDQIIFQEDDEEFEVDMQKSLSERFLCVTSESSDTGEAYILDLNESTAQVRSVAGRTAGTRYRVVDHEDELFIYTDAQGADNFKIMRTPISQSGMANWTDLIAYDPATKIENFEAYKDHLVLTERNTGLLRVRVRKLSTGDEHFVTFPETIATVGFVPKPNYQGNSVLLDFTSMITPGVIYDYDMDTRAMVVKKTVEIPSGYNPALYESKRVFATAPDGVQVPIDLVYKKTTIDAEVKPCLKYGYGAYRITIDPEFSRANLSLLDRGVVFALARPRGGGDLGEPWGDAGKLLQKKNTFTDFIACTEHLIKTGFATPGYIAMEGRSAGGLLVGAVLNQRPDLYKAAMAGKPFVDVTATMLDDSLPLTVPEWNEWGNPNVLEFYDYINSYSPNNNVKPQALPHVLLTGGLHDNQVSYWEPLKFAQRLRRANTANTYVILKTIMSGGHQGFTGRFDRIEEQAFERAFFLAALGLDQVTPTPSS